MSEIEQPRNPIEMFQDGWSIYKKVLDNNYMFHREIYSDLQNFIEQRHKQRSISVQELGCGDASQTVGALSNCQVSLYHGFDLSEVALEQAAQNVAILNCEVHLTRAHMLDGLMKSAGDFDIVLSSFALHHLDLDEKRRFFRLSRGALKENGILLLVDVMREEHEDRPTYISAYLDHADKHWLALNHEAFLAVRSHIEENDFPEKPSTYAAIAQESGFSQGKQLNQYTWHRTWCFDR